MYWQTCITCVVCTLLIVIVAGTIGVALLAFLILKTEKTQGEVYTLIIKGDSVKRLENLRVLTEKRDKKKLFDAALTWYKFCHQKLQEDAVIVVHYPDGSQEEVTMP
jgi:hypothetical protein